MRSARGTMVGVVNTPARSPSTCLATPEGASIPGARGHPAPWVYGGSPGLITNWGITAQVCGTLHGVQRVAYGLLWGYVGEEPEAGEVGIRVVWGGASVGKQRGKRIQGAGEVWAGADQCAHGAMPCTQSSESALFSLWSPFLIPGQGALSHACAGGDCGSGSMGPWWQPERVHVPMCDHQRMCSPTRQGARWVSCNGAWECLWGWGTQVGLIPKGPGVQA